MTNFSFVMPPRETYAKPTSWLTTLTNNHANQHLISPMARCLDGPLLQPWRRGPPAVTPDLADEAEARRIAVELDRLHRDGAIATKSASDPDAVFYATLLRDFGGTYLGRKEPAKNS